MKYLIISLLVLCSCSVKPIVGKVEAIYTDTIKVNGYFFKVDTLTVKIGDTVWLKRTVNRNKINSKQIKL